MVPAPYAPATASTPPTTAVAISFRLLMPPFLATKKKIAKTTKRPQARALQFDSLQSVWRSPLPMDDLLRSKLDEARVSDIVADVIDIEREFICDAFLVALGSMNGALMGQYIEFVTDLLLMAFCVQKMRSLMSRPQRVRRNVTTAASAHLAFTRLADSRASYSGTIPAVILTRLVLFRLQLPLMFVMTACCLK
ncbi:hypothetical protein PVAP13_2KG365310 [Panicum virgatum]|uniref:Uncharacterized protein n=1 Tax=Panicum virgatum TaxID=38727 RepID=A0A8T0WDL6_PANVG|nr:hypothetical protein PVAP13_2KG365310 [Panicum virgatum]